MATNPRKLAAIFLALGLFTVAAARADFIWNDATGDWFTPGNWTPAGPPGSGQHAQINNGGTAQVTSAGAVCNILLLGFNAGDSGTVDVSGSGTLTTSSEAYIGRDGAGVMDITGGGDVSSTFGVIANSTGSTGTVDVDGAGSTWTLRSQFLEVGASGTGSLNITNGGAVSVATGSTVGLYGMGTATVNGTGSIWTNTLGLVVGYSGNGTLNILNGGAVSNTTGIIGQNTGGVGVINVDGTGSTWTNSSSVDVGFDGNGTLNITNGGAVTVNGSFFRIGTHSTATGTVFLDGTGSSLTVAHEVDVGRQGTGTLTIQNGATFSATGT
ncbi:MAG TPA: hypothetical protein VFA58_04110, partial [Chthoniobacterales bacterium]|nr:hypothetical protein [Chthoniobacterales bacterium]